MEYSRKVPVGGQAAQAAGTADSRVMDFGSVFLVSPSKTEGDDATSVQSTAGSQQAGYNVAEMVVSRGYARVVRHREFEERSNYYDALLTAEAKALANKKGIHSQRESPAQHIQDLTNVSNDSLL